MATEPRPGPITHIAGPDITVHGRYVRQRCAWCGTVLLDHDLTRVASVVTPGQQWQGPATWPLGKFIRVDGNLSTVVEQEEPDRMPDDCCGCLPPELTAL